MKKYWFILYPNTFLWIKGDRGLVYNTDNNTKIKFDNKGLLTELTTKLLNINNTYCISITEEELQNFEIKLWIHQIIKSDCGNLTLDDGTRDFFSLPPILKVQDEIEYYKWEHRQGIDGNIIQNLHQLIFYINGSEFGNNLYSKQTLYPIRSKLTLDIEKMYKFAMNARFSSFLSEISLVGNPFIFSTIADTINKLQTICPVIMYITIQDFVKDLPQAKKISDNYNINLVVTEYFILEQLLSTETWMKNISYTFIITSEEEYERASTYIDSYNLHKGNIVPIYTKTNLSFLEEYLFIDEEDIQSSVLSKREIYIRQTLNIFYFGKLHIMPNGKVYSNRNNAPIGNINEAPHNIVYREIIEGNSWLYIRKQKPCCDCIYQWLCPSPSSYEQIIGKSNLCKICPQ